MADVNRGQLAQRLGRQTRVLQFRTGEVMMLEKRLGSGVLEFLAAGGGPTLFCVEAIFCGLSKTEKSSKHTPGRIATWIDDDDADIDIEDLQKEVLYAIARGKPKEEGRKMIEVLDNIFDNEGGAQLEGEPGPLESAG